MNDTGSFPRNDAARLRSLTAVNLRAAADADSDAAAADPALSVRLRTVADAATSAARAAAWAAGYLDGDDGAVEVRLLTGRVSLAFGDKALITVPGEPEPRAWHSGDITRQAGIARDQLDGRDVRFVAEDRGNDEATLHGFEVTG